jgi:hypothetical protein
LWWAAPSTPPVAWFGFLDMKQSYESEDAWERILSTGSFNEIKNFIRIIINNNASITILPDTLWKNIEHNINMKLDILYKDDKTINCIICLNDVSKYGSCNKCSNCYCILCYIELFKTGSGIITCPFCRYSFGIYTPNYMINKCINEIKIKSGI